MLSANIRYLSNISNGSGHTISHQSAENNLMNLQAVRWWGGGGGTLHCVANTGQRLNHQIRSMGVKIEDTQLTQLTQYEIREGVQPTVLNISDRTATLEEPT